MPDIGTVVQAVQDRMTASWAHGDVPVFFENTEQTLPVDGTSGAPKPFLHLSVETVRGELAAFGGGRGNNRWRTPGEIMIRIFVPRGSGRSTADDLAEDAASIFRGQRFGADIDCFEAGIVAAGDTPDGNYWLTEVAVGFSFDQVA